MDLEKKKVVAINSSKRKANTYSLLMSAAQLLKNEGIYTEIINLYDYDIKECMGCECCIKKDQCVLKDDVELLMNKLKDCDGIILSSPVYMGNISGKLKVFIDRTCKWFHRPELVGKPVFIISTTAASGLRNTLDYMENVAVQWGMQPVGRVSRRYKDNKNYIEYDEIKKFIQLLRQERDIYKPKLSQLISYQVQKVLALKILTIDRDYWIDKKWDRKIYYYDCRIGFIKRTAAGLFYRMLYNRVQKVR